MHSIKRDSKYFGLFQHLRSRTEDSLSLYFSEIERWMGGRLPVSARKGKPFWSNRGSGAHQAKAWMQAGYHVVEVDLAAEVVTFSRPVLRYEIRRVKGSILWNGPMIQALRVHMDVNQSGLAEILGVRQQTVSEWETGLYKPTRARSKHLTMVAERADFVFGESDSDQESSP